MSNDLCNRACTMCNTDISDMPDYCKACTECYPAYCEKYMRKCIDCEKHRILKAQPRWKNRCATCYKEGSSKPWRECRKCNKFDIHPLSVAWRDRCTVCFLKSTNASNERIDKATKQIITSKENAISI